MASDTIYIRQYRPSDFSQIRALLFEGFVTSRRSTSGYSLSRLLTIAEGSVTLVAKRRFLLKAPSLIAYLLGGVGLGLISRPGNWSSPTAGTGALLCAAGVALFAVVQRSIPRAVINLCETALATDMRDISAHYCAPGEFFVAAQPRASGTKVGDQDAEEVLGYVGLGASAVWVSH